MAAKIKKIIKIQVSLRQSEMFEIQRHVCIMELSVPVFSRILAIALKD